MRRALLILTATEPAVFSERAATEGGHHTLLHPPGSALLGWAASATRYESWAGKAFDVFHSGKVRFSNALPLTNDGHVAFPMPQLLMELKHARGGVNQGKLVTAKILVGRKPGNAGHEQYEPLSRAAFVTSRGNVMVAKAGNRLRTAVRQERAAEGQLFGYAHLLPRQQYAATIEAEDGVLDTNEWDKLLDGFRYKALRLGRASSTFYGGAYECQVIDTPKAGLWPLGTIAAGQRRVRVWALSDLCLVDSFGASCFVPACEMLALPQGGEFCGADSAIGLRRYAPWNGALDCGRERPGSRDVERQVISAGSVLTFTYVTGLSAAFPARSSVGLWREAGLGRIWVNPPLLGAEPGELLKETDVEVGSDPVCTPDSQNSQEQLLSPEEINRDPLVKWLHAMHRQDVAAGQGALA